eukprot:CAMPEP_0117673676 /NCGR_PEP_ID=MMETSP0804-20121206/14603_1 /TAXON_ID=1074897 /ORGANISM="Tetraselmis astigmatica, Strain CCMP880" /LENGTH=268 /DNA_ID=CAMNT_0005482437 /DNA_START=315 /DNA_END=1122 /DNA_ORIENTATION=-
MSQTIHVWASWYSTTSAASMQPVSKENSNWSSTPSRVSSMGDNDCVPPPNVAVAWRKQAPASDPQCTSASLGGRLVPPWEAAAQFDQCVPTVWNTGRQAQLLKSVVAEALNLSQGETETRLVELQKLIPDMAEKLPTMKATIVTEMVRDTGAMAQRLVRLKRIFPSGNVSKLGTRCPALLLMDATSLLDIEEKAGTLRKELPGVNIDHLVSAHPNEVLCVESFLEAVKEARRLIPDLDVTQMLTTNPTLVFSFEKGPQQIPYDDPVIW